MNSIGAINDILYYENDDYYQNEKGEPQGKMIGLATKGLGIKRELDPTVYRRVFSGFAPDGP
ncbi:hypothetical protein ABMY41_20730, partial [Pseudoalteromonas sp. BZA4]